MLGRLWLNESLFAFCSSTVNTGLTYTHQFHIYFKQLASRWIRIPGTMNSRPMHILSFHKLNSAWFSTSKHAYMHKCVLARVCPFHLCCPVGFSNQAVVSICSESRFILVILYLFHPFLLLLGSRLLVLVSHPPLYICDWVSYCSLFPPSFYFIQSCIPSQNLFSCFMLNKSYART